jgi:hypothetical protein
MVTALILDNLWRYSSIVIAGIYVGLSKVKNKLLIGAVVGLLYLPISNILALVIVNKQISFNLIQYTLRLLIRGLVCAFAAWSTCMIISLIRKRANSAKPTK